MKKIIIFLMLCTLSSMVSCGMDVATSVDYIDESTSETTTTYIKENDMNSMIGKNDVETASKNATTETTDIAETTLKNITSEITDIVETASSTSPETADIVVDSETSTNEALNVNTESATKEEFAIKDTENIKSDEMAVDDSNDFIETEQQIKTQEVLEQFKETVNIEKIKNTYSADELINYICYDEGPNFVTFMYDLNEKYPMEHMVTPDKSSPYCIYNLNNGYKLFVFFDDDEDFLRPVTSIFAVKDLLTMSDFDSLECGMSLNDVESVDAGIKLINSIKAPFLSESQTLHITSDGFVKITYSGGEFDYSTLKPKKNEDYIISSIEFIPNGSNFNFSSCGLDIECIFTLLEEDLF